MSIAAKLKQAQAKRIADAKDAKDRANEKAQYQMMLERQLILKKEAELLAKEEAIEKAKREAEARGLASLEEKTHKYYGINNYSRKKAVEGMVCSECINSLSYLYFFGGYNSFYLVYIF